MKLIHCVKLTCYIQVCQFDTLSLARVLGYHTHFFNTVKPPNKGHFGNGCIVLSSEVVPISEAHHIMSLYHPQKCLNRVDNKITVCL